MIKKIFIIFIISTVLFFGGIFIYKGSIESFKDYLTKQDIEYKVVSYDNHSSFSMRLLGKNPHHLQITNEDFLHIYKFPINNMAKSSKERFLEKTANKDMVAHNVYVVEDMLIIYEYNREVNNFDKSLVDKITGFEEK